MNAELPSSGLELRSLVKASGALELSLSAVEVKPPGPDEVVIRVEAAPINPSDLGLLLAGADLGTMRVSGEPQNPVLTADIPPETLKTLAGRLDRPMAVGNEGAGMVVAAGASQAAQDLLGRAVAVLGGGMYAQYRTVRAADCLVLPEGATATDGASAFVNPLTALGMVETMRREGHTALVHTAAASNLGQMLNRLCLKDGIGLVNIVRGEAQAGILREAGAAHVCVPAAPSFAADLAEAVALTGATLAFDAVGGGRLAGQILAAMEAGAGKAQPYSRYGSAVHKQVYVYGSLDTGPTVIDRSFGMTWGVGGWLVFPFMARIGEAEALRLRERVAAELKTTFASRYSREVALWDILRPDVVAAYSKRATGEKYLLRPNPVGGAA